MKTLALPAPSKSRDLDNYRRTREAHLGSHLLHASSYTGPRAPFPDLEDRGYEWPKIPSAKPSPTWQLQTFNAPPGAGVWVVGCIWNLGGGDVSLSMGMVITKTAVLAKRKHLALSRKENPKFKSARPVSVLCWMPGTSTCENL